MKPCTYYSMKKLFLYTYINFIVQKQDFLLTYCLLTEDKPKTKILDKNSDNFRKYVKYCSSTYDSPAQDSLNLIKVIVIHRHGDRAPLSLRGDNWKEKTCVSTDLTNNSLSKIKEKKCEAGDLTRKGYSQMVTLGNFIKNRYKTLDFDLMKYRCTVVPRTWASLHGVLNGINNKETFNDVEHYEEAMDSLMVPKNCQYLNTVLHKTIADYFTKIIAKDTFYKPNPLEPPQRTSDYYLTALCNDIPLDCSLINCEDEIIQEYIDTALEAWKDQADKVRKIDNALEIVFGRFSTDLKNYLTDNVPVRILSVHDSSLTVILAGLGTELDMHPAYASAIFIEIYEEPKSNENNEKENRKDVSGNPQNLQSGVGNLFGIDLGLKKILPNESKSDKIIRIIFNDTVAKTTIDSDTNIPFNKLIAYLDLIVEGNESIIDKCYNVGSNRLSNSLNQDNK